QGSGMRAQPLFLPGDGLHDGLIVDGHPKAVIRSARLGCQSRHGRHDPSDVMTDRTSVIGTSYTRRNAPIRGASTKGIRPSFAFLSRDIAPTTGSMSIAPARTGSPSASRSFSCRETVSSLGAPGRAGEPGPPEELFLSRARLVVGDAEPARQAGLGDHAQRDRLAVGEPLVFRGGLERVTDGVAVIEHVSQLGLALVALDDRGLEPAGAADDALEHVELASHEGPHVALEIG